TTSAELIRTYAIRDQYEKGLIPVAGPDAEATRARILGVLSNTIAALERVRAGLAERERGLTREELVAPLDAARDAWLVATRNRDAELSRYETEMGPLEVSEIRIEDGSGTVFAGHWTAADPDSP